MIRHDIVNHPTALQIENLTHKKSKSAAQAVIAANQAALDTNPLETFTDKEIANAREVLANEMEFVKSKMAHGDLPIESYTKVWEECYAQVLFVLILNLKMRVKVYCVNINAFEQCFHAMVFIMLYKVVLTFTSVD